MPDNTTRDKALAFLKHHHMGILSTASPEGHPWGSAIYFVVEDDFTIYFLTRKDTLKYQNIEANPHVALTVAENETQTTVQLQGKVSRVPTEDIVDVAFKKLAAIKPRGDINWMPPIFKVHKGDYMVLTLRPTMMQFADYKQVKHEPKEDYIEQVSPSA